MKKAILFLLFYGALLYSAGACTTFFINKNGQLIFGRNYDWVTGNGMICSNQRGLSKISAESKSGKTISWVSQYGSLTFNQYGKEFPTGGMNEKGLVVELMWLDGTIYPSQDSRPAIGVLQWIQYQLDNCATVEELIATNNQLRIENIGSTPLHYLVADATGKAATIEFLEGKMVVHKDADLPFPVLTNDTYSSSVQAVQADVLSTSNNAFAYGNNSLDRFATACKMVNAFREKAISTPVIDYSFSILDKVAQGTHTKWSIVYDISNKTISFKTLAFPAVKNISFATFDFSCKTGSLTFDMNQAGKDNITGLFKPFTLTINNSSVNKSFDESTSQFVADEQERRFQWQYAGTVTCVK